MGTAARPHATGSPSHFSTQLTRERIETLLDPTSWTDACWIPYLADLARSIMDWREHPAVPHLIARHRWVAFQKAIVYRYIETLINWADAKFRQFQRETVVEATQLYVLASKLLGPRPRGDVPRKDWSPQNYAQVSPCIAQYDQRLSTYCHFRAARGFECVPCLMGQEHIAQAWATACGL